MKTMRLSFAALIIIGFISGCKDEDKSNTDLLLGQWTMTALTADSSGTIIDIFATLPACNRDDHFIFQSGGSFISDEGATKCDSSDMQQTPGSWAFSNNETSLTIIDGTDTISLNNIELSESTLKGSFLQGSTPLTATLGKD